MNADPDDIEDEDDDLEFHELMFLRTYDIKKIVGTLDLNE